MNARMSGVDRFDWQEIEAELDREGYALLPGLLGGDGADSDDTLEAWHQALYGKLAPIANRWNVALGAAPRYPASLREFREMHVPRGQACATRVCRLGAGEYQALEQAPLAQQLFPLQWVALLSDPARDFEGGEFVMTEQRPRMQSRPMVLPLRQGDAAIIAVAHRPVHGGNGYYRVNLKHAISRVRAGQRVGVEMLFSGHRTAAPADTGVRPSQAEIAGLFGAAGSR